MPSLENPQKLEQMIPQDFSDTKEDFEKEFKKKSFSEKHIGFKTKEVPIRRIKDGKTTRGEVFRFERGQILKAYNILRNQIKTAEEKGEDVTEKKNLLIEIRKRAKVLEKDLDELNRQYYENVKTVEIETKYGKFSVPVVELDLRKKEEGEQEEDERVPYFLLGSVATNYHQTAALSMGLALDGQKVLVPSWPEQSTVGRPDDFIEQLKKQRGLDLHGEYAKQTIKSMGLNKINLMGYSMGGAVALDLAQDNDLPQMQDLIIVEPPGLEEKGMIGLGKDFLIQEGLLNTVPNSEAMIKTLLQGNRENAGSLEALIKDGIILSKKHFDSGNLSKINPKGRYQVWVGTKSSITDPKIAEDVFLKADAVRKEQDPNASPVEIHIIEGGTHGWPCMGSLGFARLLQEERSENQVSTVNFSELENSGMARILKDL